MMILLIQAISKFLWFRVAYYKGVVKKTSQKVPPYTYLGGGITPVLALLPKHIPMDLTIKDRTSL